MNNKIIFSVLLGKGITIRAFTRYLIGDIFPKCKAREIQFWNRVVLVSNLGFVGHMQSKSYTGQNTNS